MSRVPACRTSRGVRPLARLNAKNFMERCVSMSQTDDTANRYMYRLIYCLSTSQGSSNSNYYKDLALLGHLWKVFEVLDAV